MRILAVGNMYPPHHLGGYEVVWQGAMRKARDHGHQVRILVSDHREPGISAEDEPDVHRTLEWYWSWQDYESRKLNPLQRLRLERRNAAEFRRHLDEFRPDVVTFWAMGGMSLSLLPQAKRAGHPPVLVIHDDWLVYAPRFDGWLRLWSGRRRLLAPMAELLTRLPTRFQPEAAQRALFNSDFMRRRATEHEIDLEDAAVVSPGIDERFQRPAPDREWSWRMLCVGRLDRQKGVDTAVAALADLGTEATLQIAGSGDSMYLAELRQQAEALGVTSRVDFTGFVTADSLPELYASADVIVFPVRWEEPWGLVPLEAMGIGRPVVATARGGSVEYLRDGENALLFEADDASGLATCVSRLAEDPELRLRLREGGLRTAGEFTAASFEDRILEEFERADSRAGAGAG